MAGEFTNTKIIISKGASFTTVLDDGELGFDTTSFALYVGYSGTNRQITGSASANNLLDGVKHTDTVAGSPARGAIIVGSSAAKWTTLSLGAAARVLQSDGSDASWVALSGDATIAAGGAVTLVSASSSFALSGDITPSQITSNQNDYNPTNLSTASTLRLSSDAARDITGLQGGSDGRLLIVHNVGSNSITLKDESSSSSAANRFALTGDFTMPADAVCILQYDSTSSRWRLVGGSSGLSGVTAGTYGSATRTVTLAVDATGRITSASEQTCTPAVGSITGLGTGVATALAVDVGSAGAFVTFNGALGTPSSGTLTNCTGLPISTGVSGLASGIATFLATPTSANLASAVTNETGSGLLVFATTPSLTSPNIAGGGLTGVAISGSSTIDNTVIGATTPAAATFTAATISAATPYLHLQRTGAGADTGWLIEALDGSTLVIYSASDDLLTTEDLLEIDRSTGNITFCDGNNATGTVTIRNSGTDVVLSSSSAALSIGTASFTCGNVTVGKITCAHTAANSFIFTDAALGAITTAATFGHNTTASPAVGLGSCYKFQLETSTTDDTDAADLTVLWGASATHATRKARVMLNVYDTAQREALRLEASGAAAMIGFLGTAAAVQQTGDAGTALVTFGLMSGTPTFALANITGTTFPSGSYSFTGATTLTGGAGNGVIQGGTGNSRTLTLKTTDSGGTAQSNQVLNADLTTSFGGSLLPTTDDGAALGSSSKQFSDASFASGAVIAFAGTDVTVTHSTGILRQDGGAGEYHIAGTSPRVRLIETDTSTTWQMLITGSDCFIQHAGNTMLKIVNTTGAQTIGDGSQSSITQTFNVSGTDVVATWGSASLALGNIAMYVGDTSNADITVGLTLNPGANDDGLLALKSSDCSHGVTTLAETDTYAHFLKAAAADGGLRVIGLTDVTTALDLYGVSTTESTTDPPTTSSATSCIVRGAIKSGTGVTALGATGNLFAVMNTTTNEFIVKGDGELYSNQSATVGTFDDYDDALMCADLSHALSREYDKIVSHSRAMFERLGILTKNDDGSPAMYSITKMMMLTLCAVGQLGSQVRMVADHLKIKLPHTQE